MDHQSLAEWIARLAGRRLDLFDARPEVTDALIRRHARIPGQLGRDAPVTGDLLIALGLLGVGLDPDLESLCSVHGPAAVVNAGTAISDALIDLSTCP